MKLKNLATMLVAIAATATLFATPAQATLLGRDINGHAVAGSDVSAVFLYDTDLNITWLRDANASATAGNTNDPYGQGYGGFMSWGAANTWANNLTVGTFSGWRLPTTLQPDAGCSSHYSGFQSLPGVTLDFGYYCTASEMGHLWYVELGNPTGFGTANSGNFLNIPSGERYQSLYADYWSMTSSAQVFWPNGYSVDSQPIEDFFAWSFDLWSGSQYGLDKSDVALAIAVRPGDVLVASVPEPGTLLLVGAAVAALGVVRRRRAIGTSET